MDDLLIKYLLGEATPEEATLIERWLEADAANRKRYEQYKSLWAISRRTADEASAGSGSAENRKAWRQWQSGLGRRKRAVEFPAVKQRTRTASLRLAAVAIGILLLGAAGYLLSMDRRPPRTQPAVIGKVSPGGLPTTELPSTVRSLPMPEEMGKPDREKNFWRGAKWLAGGRPRTDTLPDGTVFTLNRGAMLEVVGAADGRSGPVAGTVGKGLTVRLRGEAFFSVTHDPSRPFVVQIGEVAVRVLGTSFDLSEAGDGSIELAVETGAVRAGDSVVVHAGEYLSMTGRKGWKIARNRDQLYGYYLGRPLVCEHVPLRKLVEVLNRADNTPIVLGRKELGDLPLTTVFREKSPERILDIVALTFNLSVIRQGPEIILQ